MRHTIETAPRNGKVVILEDDASGTYDVAHWSPEAGEWIGENGEPSKITPSHWYPLPVDNHLQQELSSSPFQVGPSASKARRYSFFPFSLRGDAPQPPTASEVVAPRSAAAVEAQTAPTEVRRPSHARRGFAISWIAATLVTAALVGTWFHAEGVAGDEAAQLKQAAESATAELRQSLQREHDRAEALATELAQARRDLETQVALSSKKGDEAAQFKQAAESATAELRQSLQRKLDWLRDLDEAAQLKQAAATAELRQSLQREHDRAEALVTELAQARRDLETQVALSSKKGDEAAQLKQAAESATAELGQSLQREHERAEALVTELAQARRTMEPKPAGVEEKPAAKQSEDVAAENSKPENKPVETAPLPKRVEHEPRGRALSSNCFYYRTYDPASGTYRSYDGRIRSCR
jgi:hypothetical protein